MSGFRTTGCGSALVWLAALLLAPHPARAEQPTGAIRGAVYDGDFQVPLSNVRVSVVEALLRTATNAEGSFLIENVPPGRYTISFSKDGYDRYLAADVVVVAGQLAEVQAELNPEIFEMEELVVSGADLLGSTEIGLLNIRAESVIVQDSVSNDLISKAGATDAAAALPLVVGASVREGKYATVRGLSDRYTGTTLNGVRVPSADPRRRAVQLDIFPTGTIESVTVTKSFTPDLQGEFTGGGVEMKTKSIPDGPVFEVGAQVGYNSIATGNDQFLTYKGGGASLFDDGGRGLPQRVKAGPPSLPPEAATAPFQAPTAAQQAIGNGWDSYTKAFTPVIGTSRGDPFVNWGFAVTAGNVYKLGGDRLLGVLGALTYKRQNDLYLDGQANVAYTQAGQRPSFYRAWNDSKGTEELLSGFLGTLLFQPNEHHEFSLKLIGNFNVLDNSRFLVRPDTGVQVVQNQALQYIERSVASAQLHGRHELQADLKGPFKDIQVDWFAAFNGTAQEEPDVRFFQNGYDPRSGAAFPSGGDLASASNAQLRRRIWREIDEENVQVAGNARFPFEQWGGLIGELKAGVRYDGTDRTYVQDSYTYRFTTQQGLRAQCNIPFVGFYTPGITLPDGTSTGDPDLLWTDVFLDSNRVGLDGPGGVCYGYNQFPRQQLLWTAGSTGLDVDYTGEQTIPAAYAMATLPVTRKIELIGGVRYELTDIAIEPISKRPNGLVQTIDIDPNNNGNRAIVDVDPSEVATDIHEDSWLPSLGLNYKLIPNMTLRFSASRTVARPTFRELAPVATEEALEGDEFYGNPDLILSDITNFDVRWEWFRRPGEVLAFSTFYKDLTHPIEYISFAVSDRNFVQPKNFETATLRGFEVEGRTALDVIHRSLRDFAVGLNYTYLDSEVDVPLDEQESLGDFGLRQETRRLQGQPEFLFNANMTYDNARLGLSAALFYNLSGDTLITGAARGASQGATPNVFEQGIGILNLTFRKRFAQHFTFRVQGKNLLTPEKRSVFLTPDDYELIKSTRQTPAIYAVALGYDW